MGKIWGILFRGCDRLLQEQILLGLNLDISSIVSPEKQAKINTVIAQVGCEKLAPIKELLPEEFIYDDLRLVSAFHRRNF